MQYRWLSKNNNKKLIVFFAGWGFDFNPFKPIHNTEYDILVFYDYNDTNIPCIIPNYEEKILISWSMGVYVAYLLKDLLPNFDKKIAINGTPYPINNELGIPDRTFNLTLKYAETGLQGKFYENVFANEDFYKKYLQNPVQRTIQNRVDELVQLNEKIKSLNINYDKNFYDIALVSNQDKIIPPKNQIKMWGDIAINVDAGHFPFYNYNSWDEICKLTLNQ